VTAFVYLAATLLSALLAVLAGVTVTRMTVLRKVIRGEAR
jgi:CrcB protein